METNERSLQLAQTSANLPAAAVKALNNWLDSPEQYYATLPVPSHREIITSDAPVLSTIKRCLGEPGARAVVALALSELVLFFNVGKNMNAAQIALTTDLILDRYWYFKVEELKACFRNAMVSAKVYDRIDGNLIMGWLADYDLERDNLCEQINIDEKNAYENMQPQPREDGSQPFTLQDYFETLEKKAAEGDEEAKQQLKDCAMFRNIGKERPQRMTHEEFRRWYATEYLPNKYRKEHGINQEDTDSTL